MKYLFIILLALFCAGNPCSAQKIRVYTRYTTEKEGSALAGISFQYAPVQLLIQGAAAPLGPKSENAPSFSLNNWGVRITSGRILPAEFLSFSIGRISAGGIVSRVKQPVPAMRNPLTTASLPETGFSHALPGTAAETVQPVSAAIKLSAKHAEFGMFISLPETFGRGVFFPMYAAATLRPPAPPWIRRWNISLLGGAAPVSPDKQDTWFRRRSWFHEENTLYSAAECGIETKRSAFFLSMGVLKHPAGGFSGYIRGEGSVTGPAAGVTAVFSFTDPEYISFSGKTPDIVRVQLNPHLTLSRGETVFRLGAAADMRLRRNSSFSSPPCTTETFRLEARLSIPAARITFRTELKDCAAGTGISLAGIFTPRPVGSSRFRVSAETVCIPPYGTLRRSWSFAALFEAYPAAEAGKEKKMLSGKAAFSFQPLSFLSLESTVLYTEKISAKNRSIGFEQCGRLSVKNGKTGHSLTTAFSGEKSFYTKDDQFLFKASIGYSLNITR